MKAAITACLLVATLVIYFVWSSSHRPSELYELSRNPQEPLTAIRVITEYKNSESCPSLKEVSTLNALYAMVLKQLESEKRDSVIFINRHFKKTNISKSRMFHIEPETVTEWNTTSRFDIKVFEEGASPEAEEVFIEKKLALSKPELLGLLALEGTPTFAEKAVEWSRSGNSPSAQPELRAIIREANVVLLESHSPNVSCNGLFETHVSCDCTFGVGL